MEYGIQLAPSVHHWKVVKRAEEMGFTQAWFLDTPMQNAECFVAMTAAAMHTTRIKLAPGVLVPGGRIAPLTASALASLNALAPGRVGIAFGTGFTARRTIGLPAVTLARLEDYIRVLRGLLAGEIVEWSEEGGTHKVGFLNPELGLINLADPIPMHISAFGPKGRAMTARLGTGWLCAGNPAKAAAMLGDMKVSWTEAGRDAKDLYATTFGAGCVLAEGEAPDSPRARAQVGPAATILFHDYAEHEEMGEMGIKPLPQFKAQYEAYRAIYQGYEPKDARYLMNHKNHLMTLRPEEEALITPELMRATTLIGTEPELVERLRGLKAAGFSQFAIHLRLGHEMEMLEEWAGLLEKV